MRAPPESLSPTMGHADLEREVHDLADLLRVRQREGAAEDGEVLGEDVDRPPVDARGARDDAVAQHLLVGHAEVGGLMDDEPVQLLERALVDEPGDALPRRPLAGSMLPGDALGPAPELRRSAEARQLGETLVEVHPGSPGAGSGGNGLGVKHESHSIRGRPTERQRARGPRVRRRTRPGAGAGHGAGRHVTSDEQTPRRSAMRSTRKPAASTRRMTSVDLYIRLRPLARHVKYSEIS